MADDPQDIEEWHKDKKALSVSEVSLLLTQFLENQKQKQTGPDEEYVPNHLMVKTMEYTNQFSNARNLETVTKIRMILAEAGLTEQELATVAGLSIATVEEAKALVPSLEGRMTDEELSRVLNEVSAYRDFQ